MLIYEFFPSDNLFGGKIDEALRESVDMTVTRALGGIVFLTILVYLGYKVLNPVKKPFWRSVVFALPALAVVVNNLPIYPLFSGIAKVTAPAYQVLLLALECLMVGLFEEVCFRGVILLGFLEKRRGTKKGQFVAIVLSSAVFGAVHLVNIFFGASPGAVVMQIGYSFLIGAMCSAVLMKTANLWLCVILHSVFNFCGALVPRCGEGIIWEPFTVTVTVVIALLTTVYMVLSFLRIKTEECDRIYK
jgi:membrane protease YdiL (CAAX protease family)